MTDHEREARARDWADIQAADLYNRGPIAVALRTAYAAGQAEMRERAAREVDDLSPLRAKRIRALASGETPP